MHATLTPQVLPDETEDCPAGNAAAPAKPAGPRMVHI